METINLHPQYLIRRSKTCISHSPAVAITSSFLHPSRVTSTVMAIRGRWKLKGAFQLLQILIWLLEFGSLKRSSQTLMEKVSGKRKFWHGQNTVKWKSRIRSVTMILTTSL